MSSARRLISGFRNLLLPLVNGFSQSYFDYFLFTYAKNGVFLCILIYMDDLLIFGNNTYPLLSSKHT